MQYALSFFVAFLLASAQALWRVVAQREGITPGNLIKVLLTPYFLGGAFLYIIATVIYLYLQSKFLFTQVQSVLLVSSLLVSFTFAAIFFSEKITPGNFIGVALLIVGILLVVQKQF